MMQECGTHVILTRAAFMYHNMAERIKALCFSSLASLSCIDSVRQKAAQVAVATPICVSYIGNISIYLCHAFLEIAL